MTAGLIKNHIAYLHDTKAREDLLGSIERLGARICRFQEFIISSVVAVVEYFKHFWFGLIVFYSRHIMKFGVKY